MLPDNNETICLSSEVHFTTNLIFPSNLYYLVNLFKQYDTSYSFFFLFRDKKLITSCSNSNISFQKDS